MTSLVERVRAWATMHHFAQLALLVQPLIVFRTAGEYLRLKWTGVYIGTRLLDPLFTSIAAVAAFLIVSLILYFNRQDRVVLVLTLAGIVALIAYKLIAMPGLS